MIKIKKRKIKILLVALNMRRYYSLALPYLKLYAYRDKLIRERADIRLMDTKFWIQVGKPATWYGPIEVLMAVCRTLILERNLRKLVFLMKSFGKRSPIIVKTYNFLLQVWIGIRIAVWQPSVCGFSCNIWNIDATTRIAMMLKKLRLKTLIVFGGQEVTNSDERLLEKWPFVDIIVDGEGEQTFLELLKKICSGENCQDRSLDGINGLVFRKYSRIVVNKPRETIANLDEIPSPYLNSMINEKQIPAYCATGIGMMLEISRGCPFNCAFCFEAKKYPKVRLFSMERIANEVRYLKGCGATKFHVLDPILCNSSSARLKKFKKIFTDNFGEREFYSISAEVYADYITEKQIEHLDIFSLFDVGLQSANKLTLEILQRKHDLAKFSRGVRLLHTLGKRVNIYLIAGLPGDNFFSFLRSVRFAIRLKPTILFINRLSVLSGTILRKKTKEYRLKYHKTPPYHIISNFTFPEHELKKILVWSGSFMNEYNTSFCAMKKMFAE